ncbi:MAG: hypothetical protein IT350_20405 [Deltaproteobacteria bacterium]|nr:hypothetical protein [Deltaproteobacteria bacterium]
MTKNIWRRLAMMLLALVLVGGCGCGDDDDDDDTAAPTDDDTDDDADDDTDDDTADDDTADDDDDTNPPSVTTVMTLDLEYRNSAHFVMTRTGDNLTATLTAGAGFGDEWLPAGEMQMGAGRVMAFPESKFEIHTVHFEGDPVAGSPCGDAPVTYELTLTGQTAARERIGAVVCYCGRDTTARPATLLRIKTKFPED